MPDFIVTRIYYEGLIHEKRRKKKEIIYSPRAKISRYPLNIDPDIK